MLNRGRIVARLQFLDQGLDVFSLAARGDENRIGRRHHDHVIEADHGGEHRFIRMHEGGIAPQVAVFTDPPDEGCFRNGATSINSDPS
jgi:hypothetical protein